MKIHYPYTHLDLDLTGTVAANIKILSRCTLILRIAFFYFIGL